MVVLKQLLLLQCHVLRAEEALSTSDLVATAQTEAASERAARRAAEAQLRDVLSREEGQANAIVTLNSKYGVDVS